MSKADRVYIDGERVRVHTRGAGTYEACIGKRQELAGRLVLTKGSKLEQIEIVEKWKGKGIEQVLAAVAQRHRRL